MNPKHRHERRAGWAITIALGLVALVLNAVWISGCQDPEVREVEDVAGHTEDGLLLVAPGGGGG